jgi:hypothetical protein
MQGREPSSDKDSAKSSEIVVRPFLGRIEKLALVLLGVRFKSPQDLWKFQLDLLRLQREIQVAINDYKRQGKQVPGTMETLTDLRACRWLARRLGDAFAWVILGADKKVIEPLSRNSRTVISSDSHGNRGMIMIASHLPQQGWGFPLIHDITDFLRVGDITFVRMSEGSRRIYQTVEVKTRARLKRRLEGNLAEYDYQIQILSAVSPDDAQFGAIELERTEFESVVSPPVQPVSRRLGRQAKRMSTAVLHQAAKANELIREDGENPAIWAMVNEPINAHWETLRKVVRQARRNGYGSECVDDTFLYTAFYSADGISPDTMGQPASLQEDLSNPALLVGGGRANMLSIAIVPPVEQARAHVFMPFYLYPIPRSSISDIIHGRMTIVVFFNETRLSESLEKAGFSVEVISSAKHHRMQVSGWGTASNGANFYIQLPDLKYHLDELIYEFRERDSIVHIARALFDAAANAATGLEREFGDRTGSDQESRS